MSLRTAQTTYISLVNIAIHESEPHGISLTGIEMLS